MTSDSAVISIVTSLLAAALFMLFMCICRPCIKICDTVFYEEDANGNKVYRLKFSNSGWFFGIVDVELEAFITNTTTNSKGSHKNYSLLSLRKDKFLEIKSRSWKDSKDASHAVRIVVLDGGKIESLGKSDHITFRVKARHWLSGYVRVKEMAHPALNL